jgi:hypothetical protein
MKFRTCQGGPASTLCRFLAAFALLLVAFGTNAKGCFELYSDSGATPGTKSCRIDVVSNTPGGMGNYACINDIALIDQWCSIPATDEPEQSCPVADPVYPGNGAVTLTEADFVSGDDMPMSFTRTYRSKPLAKNAISLGPVWFHSWQRSLDLANANSGSSSKVIAYRANGEPVTFNWSAGTWRTAGFTGLALAQNASGWTLSPADALAFNTWAYVVLPSSGDWIAYGDDSKEIAVFSGAPEVNEFARAALARDIVRPAPGFKIID